MSAFGLQSGVRLGRRSLGLLTTIFLLGLFLQAPATWMDLVIKEATRGVVRLANTEGSFWRGRAEVRLVPSALQSDAQAFVEDPQSFLLSKSIAWRISPATGGLRLYLSSTALSGAVSVNPIILGFSGLVIPDGQVSLPVLPLEQAGSLFTMLRPQADLQLRWSGIETGQQSNRQSLVVIDFNDFGTSLSPIKPLGSYRLKLSGPMTHGPDKHGLIWSIESLGQPVITISGTGHVSDMVRGHLKFQCHRQCEFVNGLLSAIGKKKGEVYEAKLGT